MNWIHLTEATQLQDIITISTKQLDDNRAVLVFKHSTRCSISSMALNRLESRWVDDNLIPTFFLDLLRYRELSKAVTELFDIEHASPQVLLIKNGKCFYHNSHSAISADDILEAIATQSQ